MSEGFFKFLYVLGSRLRGTPVLRDLEELDRSQWLDEDAMEERRLKKARALLAHAKKHSPFYRGLFEEAGFDAGIDSLEQLKALPSTDKETVKLNRSSIQNAGSGGKLIYTKTSGSSGEPLIFYRSASWDSGHRAAILRGLGWYGVKPWMRSGMLWGLYPDLRGRLKARAGDFVQNRFRQERFELSDEVLTGFLEKLGSARYLEGYPSFIYELARFINSGGWPCGSDGSGAKGIDLKVIKATSEKIYPHYQREALKAFGRKIVGEYGAAEAGIIAFECPEGSYHVNMDHVVVEEEGGEILVTNLLSDSFPFIRYRLGDSIRLKDPAFRCPCGRKGQVIEEVVGRAGGKILGRGERDFPAITVEYIIRDIEARTGMIAQCQCIQREKGYIDFLVRPSADADKERLPGLGDEVADLLKNYFGDDLVCRVEIVQSIPRKKGKYLQFISELGKVGGS